MSGGSHEPEEDDRQCKHCGLWYSLAGLQNHENSCDFEPVDHRVVELVDPFARERAADVQVVDEDDRDDAPDAVDVEDEPSPDVEVPDAPDVDVDVDTEPAPDAPEGRPEGAAEATTRTDGGPQELPSGFQDAAPSSNDGSDADASGDPDAEPCPEHGAAESRPIDEFPKLLEVNPRLEQFDHICVPCSTDDDGRVVSPVEVW